MSNNNGCSVCNYKGYIKINTIEYTTCDCVKNKDLAKRYKDANIPKKLLKLNLEDWNLKQHISGEDLSPNQIKLKENAFLILQKLHNNSRFPFEPLKTFSNLNSNIIFSGGKNCGKSLCLSILSKKAIELGASVKFYDWFDICTSLERYDNKDELNEISYEFTNCDLICIDGIEKIELNNQAKNHLSKIIKIRLNQDSWTLVSANETVTNDFIFHAWKDFVGGSDIVRLS